MTLVEASSRLGGKVGTGRVSGYLVERGPDSFLAVTPTLVDLCRELGLESALIKPLPPSSVFVWRDGLGLVPLPEGAGAGLPERCGRSR